MSGKFRIFFAPHIYFVLLYLKVMLVKIIIYVYIIRLY
nr:MAG TPA: hypothetical protein [Caudoviricetes sp.]